MRDRIEVHADTSEKAILGSVVISNDSFCRVNATRDGRLKGECDYQSAEIHSQLKMTPMLATAVSVFREQIRQQLPGGSELVREVPILTSEPRGAESDDEHCLDEVSEEGLIEQALGRRRR